jgi:hypothetical protein
MANSEMVITMRDFAGKTSSTTFKGVVINDVNFVAQTALQDALVTAVGDVTDGIIATDRRVSNTSVDPALPGTETQRGMKWLIGGYDSTEKKKWTAELACAKYSLLDETDPNPATRNNLDLTTGVGLALKNAVEDYHTPFGNAVEMSYCVAVSRNV